MVDFDSHYYYPTLMSRVAEIQGLRHLDDARKARIVPLFTLGKWHNAPEFERSIENCSAALGEDRPFFADLTREMRHQPDAVRRLLVPDDNFRAWRDYVSRNDRAIPVVQIIPGVLRRSVTRQAQLLERQKGQIAFRIRSPQADIPLVINALSALEDPSNAVVFVDVRYIRDVERAAEAVVTDAIDRIRADIPDARIVVLASSFPTYLGNYADDERETRGSLSILERQLHATIVADGRECLYGDYASIHPIIRDTGGGGAPIPRIDIATDLYWHFERRRPAGNEREQAYIDIATELMSRYPWLEHFECWGARMVREAAAGSPHGLAPQSWIAARVNMHLTQQVDYSDELDEPGEWDDI